MGKGPLENDFPATCGHNAGRKPEKKGRGTSRKYSGAENLRRIEEKVATGDKVGTGNAKSGGAAKRESVGPSPRKSLQVGTGSRKTY